MKKKPPIKKEFCITCKSELRFLEYLPCKGFGWMPWYKCDKCNNEGLKLKGQIYMRIKTDN